MRIKCARGIRYRVVELKFSEILRVDCCPSAEQELPMWHWENFICDTAAELRGPLKFDSALHMRLCVPQCGFFAEVGYWVAGIASRCSLLRGPHRVEKTTATCLVLNGRASEPKDGTEVQQTLALIHTSPTLTPLFGELCSRYIPDVSIFHMVDESLIADTIREGRLRRVTMRRVLAAVESAAVAGADAVLVTCSSIGPAVSIAQQLFDIPVIRVDEAMAEAAVRMGPRIGVMATLRTTLEPTIALLHEKAAEGGIDLEIVDSLAHGAFDAVLAGDTATHDRVLSQALQQEMRGVDVIVLAQASMARVVKAMPQGALGSPVLSSPELAVKRTRDILHNLNGGRAAREPELAAAAGRESRR